MIGSAVRAGRTLRALGAGSGWWRVVGSTLYLAVGAGTVLVMVNALTPYLVPANVVQVSVSPTVLATWQEQEETAFQSVLDVFRSQYHVQVQYHGYSQDLTIELGQELSSGMPPDVAILPEPGELVDLASQGRLHSLQGVIDRRSLADMDPMWGSLASWNGTRYGVYFKAANKSVVWYRRDLFKTAGITSPPATWDELMTDTGKLRAAGITPFAMCGGSAWTLDDWFENLYLQTAGPGLYQSLARHQLQWTDPTVTRALSLEAEVFTPEDVAGGLAGATSTSYPDCLNLGFTNSGGRSAMFMEGDFVQSAILAAGGPISNFGFFLFPTVARPAPRVVMVGGDEAVMLRDSPQARELINFLASSAAGRTWARQGGFISPHQSVLATDYPAGLSRALAAPLREPNWTREYDMSDQAPAQFGSTLGQGEWAALQSWLHDAAPGSPAALRQVQAELERDATEDYPPG